jgi:hypothetical protein
MKTSILVFVLAAALVPAAAVAARQPHGVLYTYAGQLTAPPGPSSLTLSVANGNRRALRSMLGQGNQQTFTFDSSTEFLRWNAGVPTVVQPSALAAGDWVRVNVRAHPGANLSEIEATASGIVGDHGAMPQKPDRPLFLFRGTLSSVGSSTVSANVYGGNHRALRLLIGQPSGQTFSFDSHTIVLLWQGKVPTLITPAQLEVGDRFVIRVRADRGASLAEVEATPAAHLADREPARAAP